MKRFERVKYVSKVPHKVVLYSGRDVFIKGENIMSVAE